MLTKIDDALAAIGALLLVPAVLAFRLAFGAALILLILGWAAADALRRRPAPGAAQTGATARARG